MNRFESVTKPRMWFMALLLAVMVTGCGRNDPILGGGGMGVAAPAVSSVSPLPNAVGVPINTKIFTASFTKAMNPSTLTPASFTLECPAGTPVSGTVSYLAAGKIAKLTIPPATPNLPASGVCTATITTGAKDAGGAPLLSNFVWTFTTSATADIIPPTVSFTSPAAGSAAVALNHKVNVAFSEAMNPSSITTTTFKLTGPGVSPVAGSVAAVGTSATFTPSANLTNGVLYTATITTGAKDLAGNAMASNFVWTFTAGAAQDIIAPTVSLTSPTAGSVAEPINRQINIGFSEVMDPLTVTTATITMTGPGLTPVAGTVNPVGTSATFTPNSNLANSTLYTVTITTGTKDLAGNALASNFVFTFTTGAIADSIAPTVSLTSPANGATAVPVNTKVNIGFSEAMDPLTITTATIKMTGPGVTPVAGTVAPVGTSATFTPNSNLANSTLYTVTITTGTKDLAGNALASNFVFTFTTGAIADSIAPTVSLTSPANGATAVPVNTKVNIGFSEAMDPLTITTATIKMTGPGVTPVAGTVAPVGTSATFTPNSNLANSTLYTVTITTGAKDLAGNALASNFVFVFTTGAVADTTRPLVISTIPLDLATGVAINSDVTASFNEAMAPLTLTTATFTLTGPGVTPVTGAVSYIGATATFTPGSNLANSTLYTATIKGGVGGATDLAGNPLLADKVWTFTTGAAPDIIAPKVTLTNPADLDTNVPINKTINATFSEAMKQTTMVTANFTVKETVSGNNVPGTVSYDVQNNIASFQPLANLSQDTDYTVKVSNGAQDLAGNALVAGLVPNPWTFRTAATVPPPPLAIDLGAASTFGIAANAAMTSSGVTQVNGDIALAPFANTPSCSDATGSPSNCLVATLAADPTGLNVNGTIYWDDGTADSQSATALAVESDLNTAFVAGMARPTPIATGYLGGEIGGKTITPGVYKEGSTLLCSGNLGTTTLDALGDPNAIFIFQVGSSITASSSCNINPINGAKARNIWFLANASATVGTGSTWNGNILVGSNLSVLANSTVNGRLLAGALGAGVFSMTTTATGPASIVITVPPN